MPTIASSSRIALLAFALSLWVEGSTQVRRSLLLPSSASYAEDYDAMDLDEHEGGRRWWELLYRWAKRRARRLNALERLAFGGADLSVAFLILHRMHSKPLLPFLITPILGELPIPRPMSPGSPRWRYILFASASLTLLHSLARLIVTSVLSRFKQQQYLLPHGANVVVKGQDLLSSSLSPETDAGHEECLICSAAGPAPLEAFCTTAPKLHPVHRACFMRWRAAYSNQRPPEIIILRGEGSTASESERRRATTMLHAASSVVFAPLIRLTSNSPESVSSVFSLLPPSLPSTSGPTSSEIPIATLLTSSPPCPGCRSSVLLHFMLSASSDDVAKESWLSGFLVQVKEWSKVVTGRTIIAQFLAQQGFVLALLSMRQAQTGQLYISSAV